MSDDVITSDARLGAAIKQMAHGPEGRVGRTIQINVRSGDWTATYEIRLLRVAPRAKPKRVGGVLVVHPKRSAPGPGPR